MTVKCDQCGKVITRSRPREHNFSSTPGKQNPSASCTLTILSQTASKEVVIWRIISV